MSLIRSESETLLTKLTELLEEHVDRYRVEAEAGLHPEIMMSLASEWAECHQKLSTQLRASGVLPKAATPEHEAVLRLVDHVKAWFSEHDEQRALIERLLERECKLAASIDEAKQSLPEDHSASSVLQEALSCNEQARSQLEKALLS